MSHLAISPFIPALKGSFASAGNPSATTGTNPTSRIPFYEFITAHSIHPPQNPPSSGPIKQTRASPHSHSGNRPAPSHEPSLAADHLGWAASGLAPPFP